MKFSKWLEKKQEETDQDKWEKHKNPEEMLEFLIEFRDLREYQWIKLVDHFMEHTLVLAQQIEEGEITPKDICQEDILSEQATFIRNVAPNIETAMSSETNEEETQEEREENPQSYACILSDEAVRKTLKDLNYGDSFWTTPLNITVDQDRKCYMRKNVSVGENSKKGTATVKVTKGEDGVLCEIHGRHEFPLEKIYNYKDYYPVVGIETFHPPAG
jgi:hypothetical protein